MKKKKKIQYSSIFALIFIISSIYIIHNILLFNKIENFLRYSAIAIIVLIDLLVLVKMFFGNKKKKKRYVYSFFLIFFSIVFIVLGFNINRIYSYIHSFFSEINKNINYSTSLVTLTENEDIDLAKMKDKKIGVLVMSEDETQNLSEDIIKKYSLDKNNEIVKYESDTKMILDLYDKVIDYAFLDTHFADIYGNREEFEGIEKKLKIVDTTEKEVTKEEAELSGSSKDVTEPFTILLIGIDSTVNGLKNADSFNGDSLIVVTFNPATMNATMLSIPRDSYVPITCMNNVDNKITHSAARGTRCVINTIQNFLNIKIDYYMKINFTGVVDLVEALGGVEIDVPYDMCEQDSKRRFGANTIYIEKGLRTLNGEQALAYSRNRKNNSQYCSKKWTQGERSDFIRSQHQQEVIQAIIDKMKSFKSIDDVKKILNIISKNLDTNMSESTMFSFYNVAKDILISSSSDKMLSIQKLYLDGTGQMIYDERSGLVLWDYILNQNSLSAVKKAMKDNLAGNKQELIKTFSYKYGENYEQKVIGKGYYGTKTYPLLTNLVGMKLSQAQTWANSKGVTLKIEYVKDTSKASNTVISQNYPESKRIDLIPDKTVTIKVVQNETTPTKVDCLTDVNNSACIMPDFVGKSKNDFTTWANGFSNMVDSRSLYEESDEEPGTILKQSIPKGTTVKEIIEGSKTIEITYAKAKENNPGGNDNPGGDNPGGENPGGDNPGGGENPGGDNPGGDNPGGGTGGGNEPDPTPEDPNNG